MVYPTSPNPIPCTVKLLDPVPGELPLITVLIIAVSAETASVMLPLIDPTVITTLCDSCKEATGWHLTDVSETHLVTSHAETPILICSV